MMHLIKKYKILIAIFLIPNIFFIVICTYRTDKEITLVGDLTNVESFINVEDSKKQSGTFSSIFVYSSQHTTIFQNYMLDLFEENDIEKISSGYTHFNSDDMHKMGVIQKNQSVEASLILSFENAKEDNPNVNIDYQFYGYIVRYVFAKTDKIKLGDIIQSINGIEYKDRANFTLAYKSLKLNDKIVVLRNNDKLEIMIDENQEFRVYEKYNIDYLSANPKIIVNKSNSVGPSAGLMQTLSVYNQLTEFDYTLGKKIAGTGTIDVNGNAGIIGGIKQKIYAAYRNKADIFFCPSGNYDEALITYNKLKNKERMQLVRVETLEDAIGYLKND